MSGGPRADELDLGVYFGVVLGFALYLPHICVRSTSGRLVSQPRRHKPLSLHITNEAKPFKDAKGLSGTSKAPNNNRIKTEEIKIDLLLHHP